MKYFEANINISARTQEEAKEILLRHINEDGLIDCSMHCTDHDPTVPYLWVGTHNREDKNMKDCTDGCHK